MRFTKMQGLGNDYLYIYGEVPKDIEQLSVKLSDRHFGAGADGIICISSSTAADFKMRIFNADGSEATMCGNGIRCVGKYLYDKGYTDKTKIRIETLSGIKTLDLHLINGKVNSVTVAMGKAVPQDPAVLDIDGVQVDLIPVSVGNPHAVIIIDNINEAPLTTLGPKIEHHSFFPGGVNVEFVQVIARNELRMRVWERGSGITMACGTGSCASVMAAITKNHCDYDTPVTVHLDGGDLKIEITDDNSVYMTGPAEFVYEGETV